MSRTHEALCKVSRFPARLCAWLTICERAARRYGAGRIRTVARAVYLRIAHGFTSDEFHMLGLLDPSRSGEERLYLSERRLLAMQHTFNRGPATHLLENKAEFGLKCEAEALAAPRSFALLGSACDTRIGAEGKPESREDWIEFFNANLPGEFVVKPVNGAHGSGFRVFSRRKHQFVDHRGVSLSTGELYDDLVRDQRFSGWLVQERLHNHPDLSRLCAGRGLSTIRVITIRFRGVVHLLHAYLRVACGDNVVDNFHNGDYGNIWVPVRDLRHGVLEAGMGLDENGTVRWINEHPDTGTRFAGSRLPLWDHVVSFCEKAARAFSPLRAVGWDVAITPAGPALIEGNAYFGTPIDRWSLTSLACLERAQRRSARSPNHLLDDAPVRI